MHYPTSPVAVGALVIALIALIIAWAALVADSVGAPTAIAGITYTGGT